MKTAKHFVNEIKDISSLLCNSDYREALNKLRDLQRRGRNNTMVSYSKAGLLIEIGAGLTDDEIICEGIAAGLALLRSNLNNHEKASLYYNLANGYTALFNLDYSANRNLKVIIGNEHLQKAKKCFRKSIESFQDLPLEYKVQLLTNYGNCLDTLGRGLEAIFAYDKALKLNPGYAMSMGNKGLALKFFADVSGKYRAAMYIESYQLLKAGADGADLVKEGYIEAKKKFEEAMESIEKKFKDKSVLSKSLAHPKYDESGMSPFEKYYIDFCSSNRLFLNLHIHVEGCEASILDPEFISIITPVEDNETFYRLAKYINQIKEDYIVARLLLAQSQYRREDFERISRRTTFANTSDYSDFNVYVGLLKSAFSEAYSIFDKIARFISQYLDLDCKARKKLYFSDTLKPDDKDVIIREIIDYKNISLQALYDIHLDRINNVHQRITQIRNSSEHERLIIHSSQWDGQEDKDNITHDSMLLETLKLFQLVKVSIIYLINAVQIRETRKKQEATGIMPEIFVDTTQTF